MPEESLSAIVTGASKGIGAATAKRLASDGYGVIVNYASSKGEAEDVVQAIRAAGGRAKAVGGDVADPATLRALFDAAETEFGPVHVLVNNAGMLAVAPMAEVTDEIYNRMIAVNVTGTFNGMREGARRVRDGGRIINVSTSVIGAYLPAHSIYAATKAAVEAMTHTLSRELGGRGITVNAVAPGPVGTELFYTGRSEELVQQLKNTIPLGRLGEPDDIANVMSFLASPQGGWINGQVIKANGGKN